MQPFFFTIMPLCTHELDTLKFPKKLCHNEWKARVKTIKTHRKILALLKSNFTVDSTFYYKELNALQYLMILQ